VTILFVANTTISSHFYPAGERVSFAAAAEATQVASGVATYWPPGPALTVIPEWVLISSVTFQSFSAAATSQQIPAFNLVPKGIIHGIKIRPITPFSGGGLSAFTLSVGDINTVDLFASAYDVFQATGSRVYQLSENFYAEDNLNPTSLYVNAVSAGANVNAATAGSVSIFALLSRS
jgi:hypothetical protein